MEIQRLLTAYVEDLRTQALYYGCDNRTFTHKPAENGIKIPAEAAVHFGTYFNAFSVGKWRKYTITSNYSVKVYGKGRACVTLLHMFFDNGVLRSDVIEQAEGNLEQGISAAIPEDIKEGIVFPVVRALEEITVDGGGYYGDASAEPREDVRLGIDICTFKREQYVKRNIDKLSQDILKNKESVLHKKVRIFISDNAKTLGNMLDDYPGVKVMPNENVGGVGGFTRGMIEAMKDETITHILIMDDDAVIEPASIEKTYMLLTLLKPEYREYTVGGELLRENSPNIQYEAGAIWNRGRLVARKHHMDVNTWASLIRNEEEETVEYAGWWYSCIPVSQIKQVGLPLPIFIHRDDIEYGLRAGQNRFIYLNGIGVWHEAFENKMPGANEYYDWRNLAIVNCIHYEDYSAKELKKFLLKWVTANVIRYRYKYVELNLRGVQDFLKGIDWFKLQDGQELHKEIMAMNYKAEPSENYVGYKGLTEEDLSWENIEKLEAKKPGKLKKMFQLITFNGYILKAKKGKVLVAMPHDNIYDMYRLGEIIYMDSTEKCLLLKRNRKQARECYKKLREINRQIDKEFEQAKKEYRDRYRELTSLDFWNRYLKL